MSLPPRPSSVLWSLRRSLSVTLAAVLTFTLTATVLASGAAAAARAAAGAGADGYWLVAADGGMFTFGGAAFMGRTNPGNDIVGMAVTPAGDGYWTSDDDGDVYPHGAARNFGSRPGESNDVTAFVARPGGDGYWTATDAGAVDAFGAAGNLGSLRGVRLNRPIVDMATTPSGQGYWLVATDGGVFSYGDAAYHGSTGNIALNQPIVGMASTPSGHGYWMVAADGGIFSYGDAAFWGSTGAVKLNKPIVGMAATPSGNGYWLVATDGGIFTFGDAVFSGSTGAVRLNQPIVGMAPLPAPRGSAPAPAPVQPDLGRASVNPPEARDDRVTVDEDTPAAVDVSANDSGLPATVSVETGPAHGTAQVGADRRVTYRPASDYAGPDSFTYRLTNTAGSSVATVHVDVLPVADPPREDEQAFSVDEDGSYDGTLPTTAPDGDPVSYQLLQPPAAGQVTVTSDGAFHYVPGPDRFGDDAFTVSARGAGGTVTVVVRVTINPSADAPRATADAYQTEGGRVLSVTTTAGVLANDSDVDGEDLTAVLVESTLHGNLTLNGDGSFRYLPAAGYVGDDGFTYRASDGTADSPVVAVSLRVLPANGTPVAADDEVWGTTGDELLVIDVLGNDVGLSDGPVRVRVISVNPTSAGTATVDPGGSVEFRPVPTFTGTARFGYTVTDADGQSSGATVTVRIEAPRSSVGGALVSTPDDFLGVGPRLVFSTVDEEVRPGKAVTLTNTGAEALAVDGISINGPQGALFALAEGQETAMVVEPGASASVVVQFLPPVQDKLENYATLTFLTDRGTQTVALAGLDAEEYELGREPHLGIINRVLGYRSVIGKLGSTRLPSGDEIISPFWRAADPGRPVQLHALAAYSGRQTYETGTTGWYPKSAPVTAPSRRRLWGIPGGPLPQGGENQRLLPAVSGTTAFTPGGPFGIYSDVDYSDDGRNSSAKIHDFRFYPVIGPDGGQVPDTWYVGWDYGSDFNSTSKNYDYQDGAYLLVNAVPDLTPAAPPGGDASDLDFSNARPGTVEDRDGAGTGFTGVQANRNGTQHAPGRIDLDTRRGVLRLTSGPGVGSGNINTQQNALEVAYDGSRQDIRASTRLIGPFNAFDKNHDFQGLYLGPDQDNFAKVEVEYRVDGLYLTLYFEERQFGDSALNGRILGTPLRLPDGVPLQTVDLFLTADLAGGTIGAAYRVNSDRPDDIRPYGPQARPGDVMSWFSGQGRAGIVVSNEPVDSTNTTTFVGTFDHFTLTAPAVPSRGVKWNNVAQMPEIRSEGQGVAVDGRLYVFGGYTNKAEMRFTRRLDAYDPVTNTWKALTAMPRSLANAAVAVDGRSIYVAGGYGKTADETRLYALTDLYRYDLDTNTWVDLSAQAPLPEARGAGAMVRLGRTLHFFGGADADRLTRADHWTLDLDDPTGWVPAASLPEARSHLGATTVGGRVLAIGGQTGFGPTLSARSKVYAWDPATGAWSELAGLPFGRTAISSAVADLDGTPVVLGGDWTEGMASTHVYAYDALANSWRSMTPMPWTRSGGVAGAIGGKLYYAGGNFGFGTYRGTPQP